MEYKLLIVDDDPDILQSISSLLEDEGYNVESANCGEAAIEKFKEFNPSVVISDMNMSGINGIELLYQVRKLNPYVQIIILTGYASIRNVAEAMSNNGA